MGWEDNTCRNNEGSNEIKSNNERKLTLEEEEKEREKNFIYYVFFGCFPGVWLLYADVSEPSIGSIFKGWM